MFQGYAFIIGAMKAGTTTLHALLSQHPAIAVSKKKEPDFLQGPEETTPAEYEAIFPALDKARHAWTLDGSTNYAKAAFYPDAPRRIAALPGEKRIIYLMRDPVDRIESHIAHSVSRGRWKKGRRDDVLEEVSAYARQIEAYEAAGLLPDMLLLDFTALCRSPEETARRVFRFLGLDAPDLASIAPQNARQTAGSFLTPEDACQWRERLRPQVAALTRYGFEAEWTARYV